MSAPSLRARPEKSIGDTYQLLGLAGSGQYGQVYCARHRQTGELVALKELSSARISTQSLLRELRHLITLDHPHITRCYALEHAREGRYLVLEYCEGGTLRDLMQVDLSYDQALDFIGQILAGLGYAHARGLIHCDVKPENLLLKPTTTGWILKLTDFGIARQQEHREGGLTTTGSPAYMAPERFYGQISPAADLYAVGIILHELLAQRRPFSGTPAQLMQAHLNQPPDIAPDLPHSVRAVIEQALRKLPLRRYQSASSMAEALAGLRLGPGPISRRSRIKPPLCTDRSLPAELTLLQDVAWASAEVVYPPESAPIVLPDPVEALYGPDPLVAITAVAAYLIEPGFAQPLIQPGSCWRHAFAHERLAWVTANEWGTMAVRADPICWPLPSGLKEAQIAWFGDKVAIVARDGQKGRLLVADPTSGALLETYPLPSGANQLVSGGQTLLMGDPWRPTRLSWAQVQPFRVKGILASAPIGQIGSAPWGFLAATTTGILLLISPGGDLLMEVDLGGGAKLSSVQADGTVWFKPAQAGSWTMLDFNRLLQPQDVAES